MRKILFVSTHFPSSLGGMRRLYHNMLDFSPYFEVHFMHIRLPKEPRMAEISLPKSVKFCETTASGMSFDPLALTLPICLSRIMRIRSAQGEVSRYVQENNISALVVHPIDACIALRDVRAPAKVAELLDSVENYYSSKHIASRSLSTLLLSKAARPLFFAMQKALMPHYDLFTFVSEPDRLSCIFPRERTIACEGRDAPQKSQNFSRPNDIVLFGRWEHPPNRDGLKKILPLLSSTGASVLIIGPNFPKNLPLPKNVRVQGFVENVEDALSHSKICLIPVWYGAGLQNKVFDALKNGCKVVSTPFTQKTFEANGFSSNAIAYSENPVAAATGALSNYSKKDASDAYSAYEKFFALSHSKQQEYAKKVLALCTP
ncbi:Glycosyl transferases group 1 [Candidatus Anstonella stagnisolia]|nr:Glycosyl transferases group 1 [Candidatus Anstonella stagnisolia]